MSTSVNQYLMVGVKLPFQKSGLEDPFELFYDETHKEQIKHHGGLAVVSDGMNCKYTVIGRILEKSVCDGWIDGPIDCVQAGSLYTSPGGKEVLAALINRTFPHLDDFEDVDIGVWFLTLYH